MASLRAGLVLGLAFVLASCGSPAPAAEKIQLPPASASWARTYTDDGLAQNATFFPGSAQTRVATDGTVVAIVGDIVGITDGPLANTSLGSGLVALLDAATGAPLFEQVISAQPKLGYALVSGLETAVVPDGVLVAGSLFGALTLGTEVHDGLDSSNVAFLAKLDRTGQVIWAKFPGSGSIGQIRVDDAGNVYLVGSVFGQFDFGGGAFPAVSEYGTGMSHLYIAKLDPAGTQLFVNAYAVTATGPTARGSSSAWGLALDASGNATWIGGFSGMVDLGSGPWTSATFLARTSATGDSMSVRQLGETQVSDLAVDPTGAPIIVGGCSGPVNLGGEDVPCTAGNGFIAKLGEHSPDYFDEIAIDPKVKFSGSSGIQTGTGSVGLLGVVVDRDGNAFLAGEFAGDLTMGDVSVRWTSGISSNIIYGNWTPDALLAGFDASGQPFWAEGFGDATYQVGQSVAVDATGRVFATGWLGGTTTFGPNADVTAQKSSDLFVAAFPR